MMRRLLMTTALALFAHPALAQDAAVLIGVERYRTLDRFVGGTTVTDAARELAVAGYTVETLENDDAQAMRELLERLHDRSAEAERLVVALSGRFVTDENRTWMMAVDAGTPEIFGLGQDAISVESVLSVMAATPGQSILLLSYDDKERDRIDTVLSEGIGRLDIPQGVTVVIGDPRNITALIEDTIVAPQADVVEAVAGNRNISLQGYRPHALIMQGDAPAPRASNPRPYVVDRIGESLLWEQTKTRDTLEAYTEFLRSFPRGEYAQAAQTAIDVIRSEPNRAARLAEDGLNLTRDQRRSIQRDLSILNYNTRGIDGIFGQGTRSAVSNWQQQNGFAQSGYLTDEQITRINAQASRRSAQLEAEAAREREAQLRRDRAYWEETGANGREAGLRSYLERYPDGLYAEQAAEQLERYEADKLAQAARADRDAWTIARNANSIAGYETYLKNQRRGAFRDEANARMAALQTEQSSAATTDQANQEEAALNLNVITRRIVEGRLAQLGFDPGPTDGRFTNESRRAIRQFQRGRNLAPTGFLTQAALVQLLIPAGN